MTPEQVARISLPVLTECSELRYRFHMMVDRSPQATLVYSLADGKIRYINHAFASLLGRSVNELTGCNFFDLISLNEVADYDAFGDQEIGMRLMECPVHLPDGTTRYLELNPALMFYDGVACSQVVAWDVTARVHRERDLLRKASYDDLTNLPNATYALIYLGQTLRQLRPGSRCVAVIYLDLDGFKRINDTHGHRIGDAILQETARRLRAKIRDTDLAARLHGDEFLVISQVQNAIHAEDVASRLRHALSRPFEIENLKLTVMASAGAAVTDSPTVDPEYLVQYADHRMYADKRKRKAAAAAALAHSR